MKKQRLLIKLMTVCLLLIYLTSPISYAMSLGVPVLQSNCGFWSIESSADQRIRATMLGQISENDCSGVFEIINNTGVFSKWGGYSLDLKVSTNNASAKFSYDDPWLIPGFDNEVGIIPIAVENQAWVNIQGDLTKRAFMWDMSIFLFGTALDIIGVPCFLSEEQILIISLRSAPTLNAAAQAALNGEIYKAKNELSKVLPQYFEDLDDVLVDVAPECAIELAGTLLKKPIVGIQIGYEFTVWMGKVAFDLLKYGGFQTTVRMTYIPPTSQSYVSTATIVVPVTPVISLSSSTAMLFDISGSMGEDDATGVTKIDAAINSGARILDIIEAENSVSQGAQIGILSFSDNAWVNAFISSDVTSSRNELYGLYPQNGTGMPEGLRLAIDQFSGSQNGQPIIIMLSDGLPNIAMGSNGYNNPDLARQQSLDLASEAGTRGICIYTVGFGIPFATGGISGQESIDEGFLKQVAANSGCGAYYNAQNATDLANVYVLLRQQSTGNVILNQTGNISQDQTVDIANVQVPDNQSMILFTLNWPGSRLDAILTDPSGQIVDENYPKASFSTFDTLASVIIQDPTSGQWNVSAKGVDVPQGTTFYNAVMSVRPNPNPPTAVPQPTPQSTIPPSSSFPVVILILVIAGGGIALFVMVQTRKRNSSQLQVGVVSAHLVCISGELIGQTLPIKDRMLVGRGSGSALKLRDRTISRRHLQFRFASGQWYIQDMSSQTGTFVNEAKVQATSLKNGDRIRIGSNVFEFRVTG